MKKWYIVHGDNAEALKLVFASVSRYTAVSCVRPEQLTDEIKRDGSLIYIGVKGLLTVPKDGYRTETRTATRSFFWTATDMQTSCTPPWILKMCTW